MKYYVIKDNKTGLFSRGRKYWSMKWVDKKPRIFSNRGHAKNHIRMIGDFYKGVDYEIVEINIEV